MARGPKNPRFRKISWKTLCDEADPKRRIEQPVVYEFSGGNVKREKRVPGPYS